MQQQLLRFGCCYRAGLGGLGPVPLASDAALAAAMSGNMPNMSGELTSHILPATAG